MALIKCSECGREISDKAAACPGCGAPIEVAADVERLPQHDEIEPSQSSSDAGSRSGSMQTFITIIVLVTVVFLIGWAIDFVNKRNADPVEKMRADIAANDASFEQNTRDRAERTIEYCEERYKEMNADRQYTPDMLRFHSMACQKLRDDYREKWGRDP